MCVQKYVYGSQRLETTYMPVRREGMGQFWDIRTMQYSATIEAKGKSNCVGLPWTPRYLVKFDWGTEAMCRKEGHLDTCL